MLKFAAGLVVQNKISKLYNHKKVSPLKEFASGVKELVKEGIASYSEPEGFGILRDAEEVVFSQPKEGISFNELSELYHEVFPAASDVIIEEGVLVENFTEDTGFVEGGGYEVVDAGSFDFACGYWQGRSTAQHFTAIKVNKYGNALDADREAIADSSEFKYCKRIS